MNKLFKLLSGLQNGLFVLTVFKDLDQCLFRNGKITVAPRRDRGTEFVRSFGVDGEIAETELFAVTPGLGDRRRDRDAQSMPNGVEDLAEIADVEHDVGNGAMLVEKLVDQHTRPLHG